MIRARLEGKTAEDAAREYFKPKEVEDYFPEMDSVGQPANRSEDWPDQLLDRKAERPNRQLAPLTLTKNEAFGRNSWMLWCGGNEAFWDWLANTSFGLTDLIKLLDSRRRAMRFAEGGLINEAGMMQAGYQDEFGLWLDVPADPGQRRLRKAYVRKALGLEASGAPSGSDGYAKASPGGDKKAEKSDYETKDAYALKMPPPEIYGLSSGVVGLRLFPNPKFDAEARKNWDARRYYDDPDYYNNPKLVRPYRVGMSCAFCHASFHPLKPPRDVTNPGWENISGNIGAQYLRIRTVFGYLLKKDNFVWHLLDSQPPGTVDTSLIATDNINNPNTMNAIFGIPERAVLSFKNPQENLSPVAATLPSLWSKAEFENRAVPEKYVKAIKELPESNSNPRFVPRVLLDGSDSIGLYGALARVYLNIGTYSEQWNLLHRPIVGFRSQQPFRVDDCRAHSVYWHATQLRVGSMRDYFLRVTAPMRLLDAGWPPPANGGPSAEPATEWPPNRIDVGKLKHGRRVYARNCIVCHSSIQPPQRHEAMKKWAEQGEFWDHDPGQWLRDKDYLKWAEEIVEQPEFWLQNYLSTDYRIPINLVRTNAGRAMATNALTGNMWEDFSSESYRKMPSVGSIRFFNPYLGKEGGEDIFTPRHKTPPGAPHGGGGPGFYRVPTLISVWATAPLLHNNSLGLFNNDPSVEGRLAAFDDAAHKLLWLEKRLEGSSYNGATPERLKKDHGLIWRTTEDTWLTFTGPHVPEILAPPTSFLGKLGLWFPWLEGVRPPWLPSAVMLVLAFGLLYVSSKKLTRGLGYMALLLALVAGFTLYFINGRLGDVRVGPIPKGTPVNLLANLNPDADPHELRKAIGVTLSTFAEIESKNLSEEKRQQLMRERVAPALMRISKCPDFVMDQGHFFEWFRAMTNEDKEAIIELLKTF